MNAGCAVRLEVQQWHIRSHAANSHVADEHMQAPGDPIPGQHMSTQLQKWKLSM